jgi:hypothetical protein
MGTWPDLVADDRVSVADSQCVTLSKDANVMQLRRRATAIRRAGLLDDALPLVHQNRHFGRGDCLIPSAGDGACANRLG